ncbi:MAG TPA: ABC transporter permease [Cyclobacteriaceae bacterium]|nr:ABC transporter permease [Cyclobacteriaceae bacterium]
MFYNYIKTAFRSLSRHRFFSFINIFGLAIAMALSMAIIMLVADQMTYDRYNTRRERIYRINSIPFERSGAQRDETATTTLPLKNELIENYTGVEKSVRIMRGFGNMWLGVDQNVNIPLAGYYADPEVLEIFEYELEYGDPRTALIEPYSVVLTKKTARKLFREENPVGEMFKVGNDGPYKVTGIFKDTNHKTHIAFDAFASMATVKSLAAAASINNDFDKSHRFKQVDNWYNFTAGWVYVLLEEGKSPDDLRAYLEQIEKKHFSNITNPDTQRKIKYVPQQLMRITPSANMNNAIGPVLPWIFVYFFTALAGIVMLTSCFNFTNLSIARSLTRAREIGVRKVTGAARWQIFLQFLSESIMVAMIALLLSVGFIMILKPLMMQLSFARFMRWDLEGNAFIYLIFVLFAVVVGIMAGFFPAVVLSGFQPVKVLKSLNTIKLFSNFRLRKGLLIAQFTFSLVFILSVIVVFNQLQLFLRADHGFSMDNKMIVSLSNASPETIKTELLKYPNIENISAVSHLPAAGSTYGESFKKSLEEKEWTDIAYYAVDEDYLTNMEVSLVTGSYFKKENGNSNKNLIVLNESAVKAFHFNTPEEAIGQEIIRKTDSTRTQIIGVVKDYNHAMLMEKIEPMALVYWPESFELLQIKYTGTFEAAGKTIETAWTAINPSLKVDYKDFKGEVHKIYDIIFGDLVSILSVISFLAILISCLGLLGMATYTTESRIKEISIRKVLGSSNGSLIYLLSKGFFVIILIAILLAVPAAYFLNNLWLEQLAYHVSVDAQTILTGVIALIAFGGITIGSQTWRAAFVNPVDNLKSE